MHMRVKHVFKVTDFFCIILILNILLNIIVLNFGLRFSCKVLSLYLRQEILILSCKVLFLEIGWFNFQENIVVFVRRLKLLVTCEAERLFSTF